MPGLQPLQPVQTVPRPFPAEVTAGATGAGSLSSRGAPLSRQQLGEIAKSRSILPGFDQSAYPAPYSEFDDSWDYILPGTLVNPNQTPRTHAAPFAGWAGDYNDGAAVSELNSNIMETHSEDFGALRNRTYSAKDLGANDTVDIMQRPGIGESNLQPLTGQIRANAGYDAQQGYGGRGSGPGGINAFPTGKGTQIRFTNPQPTYSLTPAERPFIAPQGGINAKFTDAVQGPQADYYAWSYGDAAALYTPPSAYNPPSEPDNLPSGSSYVEGPIF